MFRGQRQHFGPMVQPQRGTATPEGCSGKACSGRRPGDTCAPPTHAKSEGPHPSSLPRSSPWGACGGIEGMGWGGVALPRLAMHPHAWLATPSALTSATQPNTQAPNPPPAPIQAQSSPATTPATAHATAPIPSPTPAHAPSPALVARWPAPGRWRKCSHRMCRADDSGVFCTSQRTCFPLPRPVHAEPQAQLRPATAGHDDGAGHVLGHAQNGPAADAAAYAALAAEPDRAENIALHRVY